jgi:hypothetical protein
MFPKAFIYQNNLDLISMYTLDYPNVETGGELFGFWTHTGFPVVQVVTGPGEKVDRSSVFFRQDAKYMIEVHRYVNNRHGMQHLGSWHSHHKMDLARPSNYDIKTVQQAMKFHKLGKLFISITNIRNDQTEINGFLFAEGISSDYIKTPWMVMKGKNPFIDEELQSILLPPLTQAPAYVNEVIFSSPEKLTATRLKFKTQTHWIHDEKKNEILVEICKQIKSIAPDLKISLSLEDEIIVSFQHREKRLKWKFGHDIHLFTQNGDDFIEVPLDWSWVHTLVNGGMLLLRQEDNSIKNILNKI